MKRVFFIIFLYLLLPFISSAQNTLLHKAGKTVVHDSGSRVLDGYLAIPSGSSTPSGTTGYSYIRKGGLIFFDSSNKRLFLHNGSAWTEAGSSTFWSLTGNTGLTGSNFIGSIDATDLRFRTNDTQRLRIDATGAITSSFTSGTIVRNLELNSTFASVSVGNSATGLSNRWLVNNSSALLQSSRNSPDTESVFEAHPDFIKIKAPLYNGAVLLQNITTVTSYDSILVRVGDTIKKAPRYSPFQPTVVLGPAAGTGASFSFETGSNNDGGFIIINAGTSPATMDELITFTLGGSINFPNGMAVFLYQANENAALLTGSGATYVNNYTTNSATLNTSGLGLTGSQTYRFAYSIRGW